MFMRYNNIHISNDYLYVRAAPCDAPQMCSIECLSFANPWPRSAFDDELREELARYFVAKEPSGACGRVIGYCGYWNVAGEAHITNVAVHPAHRGRGVGGGLLRAMLDDAASVGATAATLETRTDNAPAIRLYERFGFERAGVRKRYYDNGKKDALIMWKRW